MGIELKSRLQGHLGKAAQHARAVAALLEILKATFHRRRVYVFTSYTGCNQMKSITTQLIITHVVDPCASSL